MTVERKKSHSSKTLKRMVLEKIAELQRITEIYIGHKIDHLEVKFDLISINLAGQAIWDLDSNTYKVRINPVALIEYQEDYINTTVPHEFAHIVQRFLNPDSKPHGKEWKDIMGWFNAVPHVTHSYDLEGIILGLTVDEYDGTITE